MINVAFLKLHSVSKHIWTVITWPVLTLRGRVAPRIFICNWKSSLHFARSAALVSCQVFEILPNFKLIEQNPSLDKSQPSTGQDLIDILSQQTHTIRALSPYDTIILETIQCSVVISKTNQLRDHPFIT